MQIDLKFFNRSQLHNPSAAAHTESAALAITQQLDAGHLPFLDLKRFGNVVDSIQGIAHELKNTYKHFVIIGMGGSINNPRMVLDFLCADNFSYIDTIDPAFLEIQLGALKLAETLFIFISKSGETVEIISNFFHIKQYVSKKKLDFDKHSIIIVEDNKNHLNQMAQEYNIPTIPHPQDIGGRFAAFTSICALPILLTDSNIESYIAGAEEILHDFIKHQGQSQAAQLAEFHYSHYVNGSSKYVTMPYLYQLKGFNRLKSQLVAESLGKEGKGITPIASLGPQDQHSLAQLYLDGPKDKTFCLIFHSNAQKVPVASITNRDLEFSIKQSKNSLEELLHFQYESMLQTLVSRGIGVCDLRLKSQNIKAIGSLAMLTLLEILLLAQLLNIDPLTQPGVDSTKLKYHDKT